MKAYKLIALDLDDTLLNSEGKISEGNSRALKRAAEEGLQIVTCSGRAVANLSESVWNEPDIRYCLLCNGAHVFDKHTRETVYENAMPTELSAQIADFLDSPEIYFECIIGGIYYRNAGVNMEPFKLSFPNFENWPHDPTNVPSRDVASLPEHIIKNKMKIQKINSFFMTPEKRNAFEKTVQERFPELVCTGFMPINLELTYRDADKGETLKWLCGHLGIDIADTIVFGDSDNDLTVLKAGGYKVAMANGNDHVKAIADMVTDSNNDDGVAHALEKLLWDR